MIDLMFIRVVLAAVTAWLDHQRQDVIAYLIEETPSCGVSSPAENSDSATISGAVWRGAGDEAQVITGGRFKHPGRHFQRSVISLVVEAAPTHAMSTFAQRLVHRDRTTEPWMPRITDFSRLSTMGVALSTCITVIARMRGWTGARRIRTLMRAQHARVSVRIGGSRTVVGCIRRRWRREVCVTDAPGQDRNLARCRPIEFHRIGTA
jgi:hypothetical protein